MTWTANRLVRRLAALLILAAAVAAVTLFVILPVGDKHFSNEQRLSAERDRLARLEAHMAQHDRSAANIDQSAFIASIPLVGATPALQAASLQEIVVSTLLKENIKPRSARLIPASSRAEMNRVGVQIEVSTELDKLISAIENLASSQRGLSIEQLRISAKSPRDPHRRDIVDARISIYGFTVSTIAEMGG